MQIQDHTDMHSKYEITLLGNLQLKTQEPDMMNEDLAEL